MSKQSRARATSKAASCASPSLQPNTFLVRRGTLLAGGIVMLAAFAVYHNSFSGSFIFDDRLAITENPTIRHLGSALSPLVRSTVGGRPVLNLTFALNYALGGLNVWGYHAFNLLIHALAGLTLFGVVRRTLLRLDLSRCGRGALTPREREIPRGTRNDNLRGEDTPPTTATWLACAVAVIWTVHPLQTESVTYISQRAESLMGLFYLLTLYYFVRGIERRSGFTPDMSGINPDLQSGRGKPSHDQSRTELRPLISGLWPLASICCCLLGMASKETMVSAPLMVLFYDRTFVAGSFRKAWQLRWLYYLGLAGTWLPLACLMNGLGQRNVGFGQGVTWWSYALTSCRTVVLYLKLAVWPHPLAFDYGNKIIQQATEALPYALVLVALLAAVAIALRFRPVMGFAGAWFFVILAPTSSIIPVVRQPMAENRLYLSLAAVVALGVLGLYRLVGRRTLLVCVAAAMGLGWLSVQRNKDYHSDLTIWGDTVAKCPDNARAFFNLAYNLAKMPNQTSEAITAYEAGLRIDSGSVDAHNNLGNVLRDVPGRLPDAIAQYETALQLNPDSMEAHDNLGNALLDMPGRLTDAIAQFEAALRIKPNSVKAHYDLGNALCNVPGRLPDAIAQYEAALHIDPDSAEAHFYLGNAFLLRMPDRLPDAISHFEAALRINPDLTEAHISLGNALLTLPGRRSDAIVQFEDALRLKPDSVEAHYNLGIALRDMPGKLPDAIAQFQSALRLKPDLTQAREILNQLQNPSGPEGTIPADPSAP